MISTNRRPVIGIPAAVLERPSAPGAAYYQFNGNYPAALAASGALPVVIPLGLPEDALADLFARLDGLCLAGGVDVDPAHYGEARHPALGHVDAPRDATELTLARWALAADLPIFGICRGIQLLNVAAGGSLYQDLPAQMPAAQRHDFDLADSPWERPVHTVRVAAGQPPGRAAGHGRGHDQQLPPPGGQGGRRRLRTVRLDGRRCGGGDRGAGPSLRPRRAVASRRHVRHRSAGAGAVCGLRREPAENRNKLANGQPLQQSNPDKAEGTRNTAG